MSTGVLANKDVNAALAAPTVTNDATQPVKEVKSMEYHRQVLASKMAQEKYVVVAVVAAAAASRAGAAASSSSSRTGDSRDTCAHNGHRSQQYVSPSDGIMSPASAKISALRSKHAMGKGKPRSLFAQASSKRLDSEAAAGTQIL